LLENDQNSLVVLFRKQNGFSLILVKIAENKFAKHFALHFAKKFSMLAARTLLVTE